jgi:hypothetical protein
MRIPIHRWLSPLALVLVLMASGCDTEPTAINEDEAAIQAVILEEFDFFTADLFSGTTEPGTTPFGKVLEPIEPWRFGRLIKSVDRYIDIQITNPQGEPATAEVTWTADIRGVFVVVDTALTAYSKVFLNNAVRFATFEQRGLATDARRGWRLTGISGTESVSDPNTVQIVSINLTSTSGVDTTYSNVSDLVNRENVIAFTPLDTVTVTVTTSNTDDVVLLHHPAWRLTDFHRHHVRRELTNNGDGTYTGTWIIRPQFWLASVQQNHARKRHFTIDVLSNGTLYDDAEPYDNMSWSSIYAVRP